MADHDQELEQSILQFVSRPGYRPVKPRVIAQHLGVPKDQAAEVKRAVKRLVHRGQLGYGASHLVEPIAAASPKGNRLVGVFQRAANGYGFVRPTAMAPQPAEKAPDIYIPRKWTRDAATGDTVLVQLHRQRPARQEGLRGEVVEILQRQTHQFVGAYFESRGAAYVQIDGTLFAQPIYVGDPGAKNAQPDDKVVIEMVRFPSPVYDGEGVITEVLGQRGKPGVDTLSILREFNLPDRFPEDVLEDARQEAARFDETNLDDRLDLTSSTIVTIDPVDARDFDDAISLERLDDGGWRLGVHIADVSYFVRPRTALDREAHNRGTSVYLPDRVLPMLPEVISNSLASLQPERTRYTKSVFMEFTAEGVCTHSEFHSAAIRSAKRLTYEEVDAFLADRPAWRRKLGAKVHGLLERMHELAMILRGRRLEHGALEMNMPEVKVDLDADGRVTGAHAVENTESHQIIEEFMLAANEAVARMLHEKGLPFLRRVHQSPSPHKLRGLTEFVRELGFQVPSLESRFELQKILAAVKGRPEEHAVNYAMLRSMQRAVYSPKEEGHYALASDCYCHFTSPIRRYPDLTVHRILGEILSGQKPRKHADDLVIVGQHCSDREQRAESAERILTKLKLLAYLSDHVGMEMNAVVTGVESFGLFVQGLELPAEGLIHADALADDYYSFDRTTHTLSGRRSGNRYRLGDLLRVVVARVDLDRRELDFRLVERRARPAGRGVVVEEKGPARRGAKDVAKKKPPKRKKPAPRRPRR